MAGFSDYLESLIMAWINGAAMPTAPATRYLGIFNRDPTDTGAGGSEVTATIRSAGRIPIAFSRVGGVLTSSADADFGAAAAAVPAFSHIGLFDAQSGGNELAEGRISGVPMFTGSISTTTLTVTGSVTQLGSGSAAALAVGQEINDDTGLIAAGTKITAFGTGTGGAGTYTINNSQNVASETMYGALSVAAGTSVKFTSGNVVFSVD